MGDRTAAERIIDCLIDRIIDKAERMREAVYSPLAIEAARGVRP